MCPVVGGPGRPPHGSHVREPGPGARHAELRHQRRDALPQRLAPRQLAVLDVGGPGVGRAHEDEHAGAGGPGGRQERLERVHAEVGAGGHGVRAQAAHVAEGGGRRAQQRLRVRSRRDGDVAALGVGEDEQARGTGVLRGGLERRPAGRAEALEAGQLELDRDAGLLRRVDHGAAVRRYRSRGALTWSTPGRRCAQRVGPQPRRVGVEAQDDLGLARDDELGQPIGEMRTGWTALVSLGGLDQPPLTAFFRPDPAVKRGTLDAAIWIGCPVRG
jgi:hypothetical protein